MRASPITPFLVGARVSVQFHGFVPEFGEVTKIGRLYVDVILDGGRSVHVRPNTLRRSPARLLGYENFFI